MKNDVQDFSSLFADVSNPTQIFSSSQWVKRPLLATGGESGF
jgi:hypothetical protein